MSLYKQKTNGVVVTDEDLSGSGINNSLKYQNKTFHFTPPEDLCIKITEKKRISTEGKIKL